MNVWNCLTFWGKKTIPISAIALTLGANGINSLPAAAGGVIFNTGSAATATIALGVNDAGHLNLQDPFGVVVTGEFDAEVGIAYNLPPNTSPIDSPAYTWQDGTTPGCLCEGWGVSGTIGGTEYSGYAQVAAGGPTPIGVVNLNVLSFSSDIGAGVGSYATSNVSLSNIPLLVTQDYRVSPQTPDLFEDRVTITNNTGQAVSDLRYVRVMDWDVLPVVFPDPIFEDYVTVLGVNTTTFLERSSDNGFSIANPLTQPVAGDVTTPIPLNPLTLNVNFIDSGPEDHGSYFRFNFGTLAAGESRAFSVFYGATPTQLAANAAIAAAEIELFSYGQYRLDPTGGTPITYIWGFKDVGGTPIFPVETVPEPNLGLGLLAIGAVAIAWKRRTRP